MTFQRTAEKNSSAEPWVRFFGTPSIPREAALTRLARIGNKVSVEISYGGLSHKIGWINHVVGELVDANGLVGSGEGTEWQGKLSLTTGMRFRFFLSPPPFLERSSSCLRSFLQPDHLRRCSRLGAFRSRAARRSKETDIAGNIQLFALIRSVWKSRGAIPIPTSHPPYENSSRVCAHRPSPPSFSHESPPYPRTCA